MSKKVVRVGDLTEHSMPMQGAGSPDIFIAGQKAWRALPAGVGAGLDEASKSVKQIMDKPPFTPPEVLPELPKITAQMTKVAGQAEAAGAVGASATVSTAFAGFTAQATALAATYTAGAAVPGGEPAARTAFTMGFKAGLAQTMSSSVQGIAGSWDMTTCPQPSPAGPHGPGLVIVGCKTVFFNNLPAVVEGHIVQEASGGPSTIKMGAGTVFIGDKAPSASGQSTSDKSGPEHAQAAPQVKGELIGGPDAGQPDTAPISDANNPPASAHYEGHLGLSSETTVTEPSPRSRTQIGVGEAIEISVSGQTGDIAWSASGKSALSSTSGQRIVLTAADVQETVTVTATDSCGCRASLTFEVIEPSGVQVVRAPGVRVAHLRGAASVGMIARVYITPATVNFTNIEVIEDDCVAEVTGFFRQTKLNGVHHRGRGAGKPVRAREFVPGRGSCIGDDQVLCGPFSRKTYPVYSPGSFHWAIPWRFRVGTGSGKVFSTVHQFFTINSSGDMTASKGEGKDENDYAKASTLLNDETSNY